MIKIAISIWVLSTALFALEWAKDIDTAMLTAQKAHKNVMVMVEGEHCRWCKKMKGRTLSDESIEKRLEKYVVVKVIRDDDNAMAKLPSVNGVPTIFFMKSNKTVIQEVLGYLDVEDFTTIINDIEKKAQ